MRLELGECPLDTSPKSVRSIPSPLREPPHLNRTDSNLATRACHYGSQPGDTSTLGGSDVCTSLGRFARRCRTPLTRTEGA